MVVSGRRRSSRNKSATALQDLLQVQLAQIQQDREIQLRQLEMKEKQLEMQPHIQEKQMDMWRDVLKSAIDAFAKNYHNGTNIPTATTITTK
jgi:DNA-binding transcriptional regulator YbjK